MRNSRQTSKEGRRDLSVFCWLLAGLTLAHVAAPDAAHARGPSAGAETDGSGALCEYWTAVAAAEHDVPQELLRAVTHAETGRQINGRPTPWPWALNADGEGHWLPTLSAAKLAAERLLAEGASNVDIGCFQLSTRWHGRAFADLDAMFDPARNARYAARFLSALHDELGSWTRAVAAFHSRTPALGAAYLARVNEALARLDEGGDVPRDAPTLAASAAPAMPRRAAAAMGSLMPLSSGPARGALIDLSGTGG